ncbi:MAG: transposase, partial [Candidatus Diapherotrites archaeon]
RFCRERGIEVHIPVRRYPQSRMQEFGAPSRRKMEERGFDEAKYRQRALIESINSAIKRTLGGYVCSRRADQQRKQVTLKALAYNLEIIGRRISSFFLYICGGFLQRPY